MVHAAEIHAESILEEAEPDLADTESSSTPAATQFDEYGLPVTTEKSNINIVDDPNNQKLTYADIEALKSDQLANPKELIAKIMANHSQLDQKTAFSLAKYTLRKRKKYMKRFTILPLDVGLLTDWMMNEKDFAKVMEIRSETLGLVGSWANIHASGHVRESEDARCRYLVVDDTGGLVVAALAEKMGTLHFHQPDMSKAQTSSSMIEDRPVYVPESHERTEDAEAVTAKEHHKRQYFEHDLATSNTLTLVHANQQPNLALLRYFSFDPTQPPSASTPPDAVHPLHRHLTTLSWLQLLNPEIDSTYSREPSIQSAEELAAMKPNQRSTYYRKRRRWQRIAQIIEQTRLGGFDALVVASHTNPVSICKHLVPLLRGGAQIVVYSPHIEPIMELCDVYSTARRTAYLQHVHQRLEAQEAARNGKDGTIKRGSNDNEAADCSQQDQMHEEEDNDLNEKFPADPTLILNFTVHHSMARMWQVLPGRTHPLMMGKGGAEAGYVAVATRVIPHGGGVVQARGRVGRGKKRKLGDLSKEGSIQEADNEEHTGAQQDIIPDVEMKGVEDRVV